jgi:hypothetical protein
VSIRRLPGRAEGAGLRAWTMTASLELAPQPGRSRTSQAPRIHAVRASRHVPVNARARYPDQSAANRHCGWRGSHASAKLIGAASGAHGKKPGHYPDGDRAYGSQGHSRSLYGQIGLKLGTSPRTSPAPATPARSGWATSRRRSRPGERDWKWGLVPPTWGDDGRIVTRHAYGEVVGISPRSC